MLTANSPGAVCARVIISKKSSSFSHFLSTSSLFMAAIIGIPPPIVKAPIFAKTKNICQSETMKLLIFSTFWPILGVFCTKIRKILKIFAKRFGGLKSSRWTRNGIAICTYSQPLSNAKTADGLSAAVYAPIKTPM